MLHCGKHKRALAGMLRPVGAQHEHRAQGRIGVDARRPMRQQSHVPAKWHWKLRRITKHLGHIGVTRNNGHPKQAQPAKAQRQPHHNRKRRTHEHAVARPQPLQPEIDLRQILSRQMPRGRHIKHRIFQAKSSHCAPPN